MYNLHTTGKDLEDSAASFNLLEDAFLRFCVNKTKRGTEFANIIIEYLFDLHNRIFINDTFVDTLPEEKICMEEGWTRSCQIEKALFHSGKIPHRTTLFRLLNELTDYGILQKSEVIEQSSRSHSKKQKKSVYYRLVIDPYQLITSKSREDLIEGFGCLFEAYIEANKQLLIAFDLLTEFGIKNPDKEVITILERMRNNHDPHLDMIDKIIGTKLIRNEEFWSKPSSTVFPFDR